MTIVDIARLFLFVRERSGAQNEGLRVEAIQKWSGGRKGDSWCCYMTSLWLDLYFQGQSPVKRSGACDDVYNQAKAEGWLSAIPRVGDLYLFMRDPDGPAGPKGMEDAHHIGIVTDVGVDTFVGISGNTSEDGRSSNGDRVAEKLLDLAPGKIVFVRYPREPKTV